MDDGAGANWCFVNGTVGVNSQSQKKIGVKSQFRYKTRVQTQEPLLFIVNINLDYGCDGHQKINYKNIKHK